MTLPGPQHFRFCRCGHMRGSHTLPHYGPCEVGSCECKGFRESLRSRLRRFLHRT